jgi:hypothetical protein
MSLAMAVLNRRRVHVVAHRVDRAVQERSVSSSAASASRPQLAGLLVDDVAPQPLQEPVHADDVRVSHGRLCVERPHRHLVEPQRVGAVVVVHLVGVTAFFRLLPILPYSR